MRTILSIDGGGIRGIIPAMILARIEQLTGKPISQLFDLIAGTSTGGILGLGLVKPDTAKQPEYSAEELAALYQEHGATIFGRPVWRLGNLFQSKYGSAGIESVLEAYFGDTRLKSALTNVLITSYEIERRFPFFFRSTRARVDSAYDFPMKVAARATSAAPTYFEPVKVVTGGSAGYYALVDGGLYANNPAVCALVEARQILGRGDYMVVSLGTGSMTRPLPVERARRWGVAGWAKPVLEITFDGVSSTVDYQLQQLLRRADHRRRYYRLQPTLDASLQDMDKTSPKHLRNLRLFAESFIRQRAEEIDELCEMLVTRGACQQEMTQFVEPNYC